jgi:hypothetical protein
MTWIQKCLKAGIWTAFWNCASIWNHRTFRNFSRSTERKVIEWLKCGREPECWETPRGDFSGRRTNFWWASTFDRLLLLMRSSFWSASTFDGLPFLIGSYFWSAATFDELQLLIGSYFWSAPTFDRLLLLMCFNFWSAPTFDRLPIRRLLLLIGFHFL